MIRTYTACDIDRIMTIWLEANLSAHDFIDSSYWQENFDSVKAMIPNANIFVYEQDDVIQGFIGLINGYIAGIFVSTDMQAKGIGKQLLDFAKNNSSELSLQVFKNNQRAVNFYLREIFTISSVGIDDNTGESEYIMKWSNIND